MKHIMVILLMALGAPLRGQTADTMGTSVGLGATYSDDEIVPGLEMGWGWSKYSGELALNCSVLLHDPYNGDETRVSPFGLGSFCALYFATLFHTDDVGPSFRNFVYYLIGVPLVLTNSRHHFWFLGDPWPMSGPPVRASVFIVSRTDVYGGDVWWVRYAPAIGLEIDFSTGPSPDPGSVSAGRVDSQPSVAFDIGIDKPLNLVSGDIHNNEPRFFAGLHYYFSRKNQIQVHR